MIKNECGTIRNERAFVYRQVIRFKGFNFLLTLFQGAKVRRISELTKNVAKKLDISRIKRWLEVEDTLVAHVEQQVEDAEIGKEAVLLLIDLPIRFRLEGWVWLRMLGTDGIAEVGKERNLPLPLSKGGVLGCRNRKVVCWGEEGLSELDVGMDVEKFAHLAGDVEIEVEEVFPMVFEKGADVVDVVVEERAVAVGTAERIPVFRAPFAVIADERLTVGIAVNGNRQRLRSLRGGDDAAVAIGLFDEVIAVFQQHAVVAMQLLIPLHGTELSGGEQRGGHSPRQ